MPSLQAKCSKDLDDKVKTVMTLNDDKRQKIIVVAVEQYCDKEISKAAKNEN
jgi:hypothetical protein